MKDNKMNNVETRAVWGISTILSLRMLGIFMILPVISTYGMNLQGANKILIGISIGIYGFIQALFQIPFGILSDRVGRKPIIIIGLLLFIIGSMIAATTISIWGIILGRALQGTGAISAAIMALLSDLTKEQNRTKAMGCIGVSMGIAFASAMVISPIITNKWGIHTLFWIIAILGIIAIIVTLFIVPNTSVHILNRESAILKNSIKKILNNSKLIKLNISIFCMHILLMSNFLVFPIQFEKANFPKNEHWKLYLTTMLISFIILLPCIIYTEKKRSIKKTFIICVAVILISEATLWMVSNNLKLIMISVQLFFLGFNLMEAILPSLISKESPAAYKGTAMGIYSTSQFCGTAIGGGIGGWIFEHSNAQNVFLLNTIIAGIWLLISLSIKEPRYISSLRIMLNDTMLTKPNLEEYLKSQVGVISVFISKEEKSAYLNIDNNLTNKLKLESLILNI